MAHDHATADARPSTGVAATGSRAQLRGRVDFRLTDASTSLVEVIARAGDSSLVRAEAPGFSLYVNHPALDCFADRRSLVLMIGAPILQTGAGTQEASGQGSAAVWLRLWKQAGDSAALSALRGRFALFALDLDEKRAVLATDRFGVHPVCYSTEGGALSFSDRADSVPGTEAPRVNAQAIYDYLYFHMIPAPATIHQGVKRLRSAESISYTPSACASSAYWVPRFTVESGLDEIAAAEVFRQLLRKAVKRETTGDRLGAYLSGGTDSSTVSGLLGELQQGPTPTYSIGFDAAGYDEMEYARIAARHFGVDHHAYYLTPDDLVAAIPLVASHYDQPFGNSSALPAYYCAKLAQADGVGKLLAGDGGDELFGGNSRYAKQGVFEIFGSLPAPIRSLLQATLLGPNITRRIPLVKKGRSYVEQALIPMPARLETYNLLHRIGPETLLTPAMLMQMDADGPAREQAMTYSRSAGASLINRMLAYDWQYTLADSDLPKVRGTCALAGIDVGFPMLDDDLLDFSLRLPDRWKVDGTALRPFFKRALAGFLPAEVIRKSKHGFGLPFGVWLTRHAGLQKLAHDSLEGLVDRGIVNRTYIGHLEAQLRQHAGYFGELAWVLMMLEQWLRTHAPTYRAG